MTPYVVDASVAIKWFVPETLTPEALKLRACGSSLHAPTFLDVEIANIVWKKRQRGLLTRAEADIVLGQIPSMPIGRHATHALIPTAFDIADRTARTVYDCLYIALALQINGIMVTADARLVNALSTTRWAASVIRVQDVP